MEGRELVDVYDGVGRIIVGVVGEKEWGFGLKALSCVSGWGGSQGGGRGVKGWREVGTWKSSLDGNVDFVGDLRESLEGGEG